MRKILASLFLGMFLGTISGCGDDDAPPPPPPPPKRKVANRPRPAEDTAQPTKPESQDPQSSVVSQAQVPTLPLEPAMPVNVLAGVDLFPQESASVVNLRLITVAFTSYHQKVEHFPSAAIHGKEKPLLSWRVALLPYLGQEKLFLQFNLAEPWDSPTNKPLIAKIPPTYQTPGRPVDGKTCYLVPVGQGTVFGQRDGMSDTAISDGKNRTLLLVEADESRAVFWTQPEDLEYSPAHPLAGLGEMRAGRFLAVFADGSMRAIPSNVDEPLAQALFSANGREVIDLAALDRAIARRQQNPFGNSGGPDLGPSKRQVEAVAALARGDRQRGMKLLHAEAARGNWQVVKSMRWSKALKRPAFALFCGVAVQASGAGDSSASRAVRKADASLPPSTMEALLYWQGEIGQPVLDKLQLGITEGRLGALLGESVKSPPPETLSRYAPGARTGQFTTEGGILKLGIMDVPQAKRLAAREGLDVLVLAAVTIKNLRVHGDFLNQSSLIMRVIDVAKDKDVWTSKQPVMNDLQGTVKEGAGVNRRRMLDDLLSVLEEEVFLSEMPQVTPEIIERRASTLVTDPNDKLAALAELRYYHAMKLLSPEQLANYFSHLIGPEIGLSLANGSEVARQKAIDKLIETDTKS